MIPPKFLRKARFALVYPLVIWLLIAASPTEKLLRWGGVIIALGELLRLWANGYVGHVKVGRDIRADRTVVPKGQLITAGPYAFVRHPLYLGTMLIGIGFCLAVGNIWLAAASLLFFLTVYRSKMSEEEQRIREAYPSYAHYEHHVPRWWPTFRRYAQRHGHWQWRGILASKEWKTVIWITVLFIVLYFHEEILEHKGLMPHQHIKHMTLMVLTVALIAWDIGFEIRRRLKRAA